MAALLGLGRCPLCGGTGARVSLSKNGLAVMTCTQTSCGAQIFARSDEADETLRGYIVKPAEKPANADPEPIAEPPAPEPIKQPAPAAEKGFRWGLLGN